MQHDPNLHGRARARDWQREAIATHKRQARQAAIGAGVVAVLFGIGTVAAMNAGKEGGAAVLAIAALLSLMLAATAASEA